MAGWAAPPGSSPLTSCCSGGTRPAAPRSCPTQPGGPWSSMPTSRKTFAAWPTADARWRYRYAERFHQRLASSGDEAAARRLADLLVAQDRAREAIVVLRPFAGVAHVAAGLLVNHGRLDLLRQRAATGDWPANIRLADLAANTGDVDQLWALDAEGNWFATQRLADIMVSEGRPDDAIGLLRARADAGDALAAGSLPDLLAEHGQVDELQARAAEDPWYAPRAWARYLVEHDRLPEAMEWLRNQGGPGAGLAASQLADLLVAQDRIEEAIAILRPFTIGYGDGPAVSRLVDLLYRHERVNDLRTEVNAGVSGAADRLLQLLLRHDGIDHALAARIRAFGLTATWPADGTRP